MAIILVIFVHIFVIYSLLPFYIKVDISYPNSAYVSIFTLFLSVWLMPLLFTIAGMTTYYSFKKRNVKEYLKERVQRLLIPFIASIIFITPILSYFGMIFHENISISFFDYYFISFTMIGDLVGYNGGLGVGHVWFILYLFIVSCLALLIIKLLKNRIDLSKKELSFPILILLGLIPVITYPILNTFEDHSVGMYLALFLLGYYVLSNDNILEKLEKNKITLGILTLILTIIFIYIAGIVFGLGTIIPQTIAIPLLFFYQVFYGWICILFLLVIGKLYLNKTNKILQYLSEASFSIYIFHMPILIAIAFYILQFTQNVGIQMLSVLILTVPLSIGVYAFCKKFKITRFLFGIK